MPCNSDYQDSTDLERHVSCLFSLLDEVEKGIPIPENYGNGHDERAYNHSNKHVRDTLTQQLCQQLQDRDVSGDSLELQIWWRDHKAADKARVRAELRKAADATQREAILNKLTAHERKLLGF